MSLGRALCAALATLALPICAAEAENIVWYVNVDNDAAFDKDRWYTSGARIYRSAPLEASGDRLDVGIAQEIYTSNTNCPECQDVDRPYAARLMFSIARQMARPESLTTLGADVGVLGPSALGRQTQDFVHRFIPAPDDDWSKQLHSRLDAQLVAARSQRILGSDEGRFALFAHGGAVLGTVQAFAHLGGEVRVGGGAASAGLTPALRYAATPPAPMARAALGWTAFAGFGVRNVWRNRLLENNADDPSPSPTRSRTVRRAAVGIGWAAPWIAINFALVEESREFTQQVDPQRFGTLAVQLDWR